MDKNQGICTNALIFNDRNEILIVKRSNKDISFPDEWELAGGGIKYKETPEKSIIREVKEECGLDIEVKIPITVSVFYIGKKQYFEITYLTKLKNNNQKITLSNEHSQYKWIRFEDIDSSNLNTYIKEILIQAKNVLNNN